MQMSIYLIEDDPSMVDFVRQTVAGQEGWDLVGHSASFAHAKLHASGKAASVYLVDLGLPDGRGEDLLAQLSRHNPSAELLVFSVFGDESRLIAALEAGATGYVLKGCTSGELIAAIEQIRSGGAPISALLARLLLKRFRIPGLGVASSETAMDANAAALSGRETDVLKLVAQGYVNKEIARKLDISLYTVGGHVKNLYRKLSAHTRVQVVRIAQDRGLV